MNRLLMWVLALESIMLLILSSFLFLGFTLDLLTTFTLGSCIPWLVSCALMWYAGGLMEKYIELRKVWLNERN
jgi:uncharacterized membrane protein